VYGHLFTVGNVVVCHEKREAALILDILIKQVSDEPEGSPDTKTWKVVRRQTVQELSAWLHFARKSAAIEELARRAEMPEFFSVYSADECDV
jgi:hypothetical protein